MDASSYRSVLLSIIPGLAITQRLKGNPAFLHLGFVLTTAIAAATRSEWRHKTAVVVSVGLFSSYGTLLFARRQ